MLSVCQYTKYTVLSDDSVRNLVIAINVISLLIAAPGNIITIAVIAKVRKLRKQPTYLFIGSVCLADAMVAIITQPLYIATLLLESSDQYCTLYTTFFVLGWVSSFGSVLGINTVTFDRFVYIIHPLRYPIRMQRQRAVKLILLTWTVALLFAVIPIAWLSTIAQHSLLLFHNVASCAIIAFTYYRIYKKVRESNSIVSNRSIRPIESDKVKEDSAMQSQATRTVLIVVLFFVLCWGPWTMISFMMSVKEHIVVDIEAEYRKKVVRVAQSLSLSIGFTGSACNVFIYTFKNKVLRKEWVRVVCGNILRKRRLLKRKINRNKPHVITSGAVNLACPDIVVCSEDRNKAIPIPSI